MDVKVKFIDKLYDKKLLYKLLAEIIIANELSNNKNIGGVANDENEKENSSLIKG